MSRTSKMLQDVIGVGDIETDALLRAAEERTGESASNQGLESLRAALERGFEVKHACRQVPAQRVLPMAATAQPPAGPRTPLRRWMGWKGWPRLK